MIKATSLLIAMILAAPCQAVTIQNNASDEKTETTLQGITVVNINGNRFSVAVLPTIANRFENSDSTETHAELKAKLPLGEIAAREEVEAVIKAYYERNAFDSASIAVRKLTVASKSSWSVWCGNPWIFGCLEWHGSGGTWVEFEVNGRNQSGGMTGYQRTIWMVRKFSQPQEPSTVK